MHCHLRPFCFAPELFGDQYSSLPNRRPAFYQKCISDWILGLARKKMDNDKWQVRKVTLSEEKKHYWNNSFLEHYLLPLFLSTCHRGQFLCVRAWRILFISVIDIYMYFFVMQEISYGKTDINLSLTVNESLTVRCFPLCSMLWHWHCYTIFVSTLYPNSHLHNTRHITHVFSWLFARWHDQKVEGLFENKVYT